MSGLTAADLRRFNLFDDLPDEQLETWAPHVAVRDVAPGEVIVEQGERTDAFLLVIDGIVEALLVDGGRTEPVNRHFAPTWMGAIPVLTEGDLGVRIRAETPVRLGTIQAAEFVDLVMSHRPVHRRIMHQVQPVLARVSAIAHNRERLATLGTMAAGLAHELNNPAAAARRSADQLIDALDVITGTIGTFVDSGVERAEAQQLVGLQREALARAAATTPLGALDAADLEDDVRDALEDLGVADAWRLAEPLARAGADREWLERVASLAGPARDSAFAWIAASLTARGLAGQLCESTDRMSRLVSAVKSYSYMDRGEVVEADLHEGLETTMEVLGHKLKHTRIEVQRDYDRSLPKLMVRGSELNQVWTNLLANAIEALGDSGTITISTRRDGDCAIVEIGDDGPGIPVEIQDRILDPFFTTKPVGKGTGLGLDTAHQIVEERHRGTLSFESAPGATVFRIRLPFSSAAR